MPKLVYVGINGRVLALDELSGEQIWLAKLKGSSFVNVILDRGLVLAATSGEIWCLDAESGQQIWHNELRGQGFGLVSIATANATVPNQVHVVAEEARREDERRRSSSTTG